MIKLRKLGFPKVQTLEEQEQQKTEQAADETTAAQWEEENWTVEASFVGK